MFTFAWYDGVSGEVQEYTSIGDKAMAQAILVLVLMIVAVVLLAGFVTGFGDAILGRDDTLTVSLGEFDFDVDLPK